MSTIEGQRTLVMWDETERDRIAQLLCSLPCDPLKPWSLVLRSPFQPITPGQHGYYRGTVLRVMAEETGHDEDECHAFLLSRHGEGALIDVHHDDYCVRTFTTGPHNTKPEMRQYMTRCVQWLAVNGIYVPPPKRVEA